MLSFSAYVDELQHITVNYNNEIDLNNASEEWAIVIAPGEEAIYLSNDGVKNVVVAGHRYTPQGLMYELTSSELSTKWIVKAANIQALHGETKMVRANLITGEVEHVSG